MRQPVEEIAAVCLGEYGIGRKRQCPVPTGDPGECRIQRIEGARVFCFSRLRPRQLGSPGHHERQRQRSSLVRPAVVVLRGSHGRANRDETRRAQGGREELGDAGIGEAVHPHLPVGSGEAGRPLNRVVPVLGLVLKRNELTTGRGGAAHILHHHQVPLAGIPAWVRVGDILRARLVIRQAHQDDWPGPFTGWPVDIGIERCAIAHLRRDVVLDRDIDAGYLNHAGRCHTAAPPWNWFAVASLRGTIRASTATTPRGPASSGFTSISAT